MRLFFYVFILVLLTACSSEDSVTKEAELKQITDLESEIRDLVDSSVCNETSECAYIAFGSKPCGGPWSYLVYSTSIDVDLLTSKVEEFNDMQKEYNQRHGIASDCAFVSPPVGLECENGKCVAVSTQVGN